MKLKDVEAWTARENLTDEPAIFTKLTIYRDYLTFLNSLNLYLHHHYICSVPAGSTSKVHRATVLYVYCAGIHNTVGFTMATEIIRQRSRKALVEVSLGKGRVGAGNQKEPPHGAFSIHWARSSSPVLQQLPARLVRVNKPSAKVKETYKEDIMQTVISVDPAEPQIEWHNHLCSFSIWKWITERCSVFLHDWLMNSIWAIYTLRHRRLCEYKNWKGSISDGLCRQSPTKNNRYLLIPLQGNSDFFFFPFDF